MSKAYISPYLLRPLRSEQEFKQHRKAKKMGLSTSYKKLPQHMRDGARLFIEEGILGGDFMMAVFSNDLVLAFERADIDNMAAMAEWAAFLKWEAPSLCWGSRESVLAWQELGGMSGLQAAKARGVEVALRRCYDAKEEQAHG